jgi:uncharacterized protein YecE (DUF72 family)
MIGVAGWDYPDWKGTVYPRRTPRDFDRLAHVSQYVDVIEINTTFYHTVASRVAESWVKRVSHREGFTFTAKSHRSWTHQPGVDLDQAVPATLDGLRPLREADRLGCLLIQFPQSFHCTPPALDHLDRLLDRLTEWPLAIEVRHQSWASEDAAAWFESRRAGWCLVDQPRTGHSVIGPHARTAGRIAYMRMHGRKADTWFKQDAGRDVRYDYLYSQPELEELAVHAEQLAAGSEKVFVIQNNHPRGKALVNALQFRRLIEKTRPAAPEELVNHYPELEAEVSVNRSGLF